MRKEFEMTEAQLKAIIAASQPVPYMVMGGVEPTSPQENANRAWRQLGSELGFVWDSARPVQGESARFFTAEVAE